VDGGWLRVKLTDPSSVPTGTQISCMESTSGGFGEQFTILIP